MTKEVTERDFRMPEFLDARVEDYEFRKDGKLVRKDRWERGMRGVARELFGSYRDFEIDEVVAGVKNFLGPDREFPPDPYEEISDEV